MRIEKAIEFDYGHRLLHHPGKCSNIHGHRGKAIIKIIGDVNPITGMVIDFYNLKRAAKVAIDKLDHAMLLNPDDEFLIEVCRTGKSLHYIMSSGEPTAENISIEIRNMIAEALRREHIGGVCITVQFFETPDSCAVSPPQMVVGINNEQQVMELT